MLSLHRRKLLEARRSKDDYDAAKRSYEQIREQFRVVFDTWHGEEYKQIRENRTLVEKASAMISQKAYTSVGQAIDKTLQNCGLGVIDRPSEDRGRSRGSLGDSAGEKEVSVLGYPAWMRLTERVPHRVPRF